MRFPKVSIIILNWNGWEDTLECLEFLYQINYPNYEVIVVDNDSVNQSVKRIKSWADETHKIKYFEFFTKDLKSSNYLRYKRKFNLLPSDEKLLLLKNDKNYGFTGGNNIAINQILKERKSDYVLLLNNDTVVDKKFLTELIKVAEKKENIGILGSKIYYYNFHGRKDVIQSVGTKVNLYSARFYNYGNKQIDKKQFENNKFVDCICGACLLIKREVVQDIGLLNNIFFAYFEDVDWGLRAKKKGYQVACVPNSKIWHKEGMSLKKSPEISLYYCTKNAFLIEKIHANIFQLSFFLFYYFLIKFPKKIVYCFLFKNKIDMLKNYLKGLKEGLSA